MKARIITAIVFAAVGIPLLILSDYICFPLAISAFSVIACWEILRVLGIHRKWYVSIPTYAIGIALPTLAYKWFFPVEQHKNYLLLMAAVFFAYLLYLIGVSVFSGGKLDFKTVTTAFTMILYIVSSLAAFVLLRYRVNGQFLFVMVLMGAWVCDVFAYFVGRFFGKHKLAPVLSPKKTVEGSLGGAFFTIITFLAYGLVVDNVTAISVNYVALGVLGLLLPVVAQIGDLWASLLKRECGIKDYSNILPGHGGIIDRFDSIFPVALVLFAVCWLYPPFV